jgi:hypothetical protein
VIENPGDRRISGFGSAPQSNKKFVIPGAAKRRPGIQEGIELLDSGLCLAFAGMTERMDAAGMRERREVPE